MREIMRLIAVEAVCNEFVLRCIKVFNSSYVVIVITADYNSENSAKNSIANAEAMIRFGM